MTKSLRPATCRLKPEQPFVVVGWPACDSFAARVFESALERAVKYAANNAEACATAPFEAAVENALRYAADCGWSQWNLDIIADATDGVQHVAGVSMPDIFAADTWRQRFAGVGCVVRLAGCNTAFRRGQAAMRSISASLDVTVVGTMRTIAHDNFDSIAMCDLQRASQRGRFARFTMSTLEMQRKSLLLRREWLMANGYLQQTWLSRFPAVTFERSEVIGEKPGEAALEVDAELLDVLVPDGSSVACTDDIVASPLGRVAFGRGEQRAVALVLSSCTLLEFRLRKHGRVFVNVPPRNPAFDVLRSALGLT